MSRWVTVSFPSPAQTHALPLSDTKALFHAVRGRHHSLLLALLFQHQSRRASHCALETTRARLCPNCAVTTDKLLLAATNNAGEHALLIAVRANDHTAVEIILAHAAKDKNLTQHILLAQDKESGWNALHRAVYFNAFAAAKTIFMFAKQQQADTTRYNILKLKDATEFREQFHFHSELWNKMKNSRDHDSNTPFQSFREQFGQTKIVRDCKDDFKTKSTVLSFGSSANYLLGYPTNGEFQYFPKQIKEISSENVLDLVSGKYFAAALSDTGSVFVWGCHTPDKISCFNQEKIISISASSKYMIFVSEKGNTFVSGDCDLFDSDSSVKKRKQDFISMFPLYSLKKFKISRAFSGERCALFVTDSGKTLLLGYSFEDVFERRPKVFANYPVKGAILKERHSLILNQKGTVFQYFKNHAKFKKVEFLLPKEADVPRIVQITCSGSIFLALSHSGILYAWEKDSCSAHLVRSCEKFSLKNISCSNSICCATTSKWINEKNYLTLHFRSW